VQGAISEAWELRKQDVLIGTLHNRTHDQPWFICDFVPTPEYEKYHSLFEDWANIVNNPRPEQYKVELDEFYEMTIGKLGLNLIPINAARPINEFMIHIYNGKEAWFRDW
jgi:hypothetical protein